MKASRQDRRQSNHRQSAIMSDLKLALKPLLEIIGGEAAYSDGVLSIPSGIYLLKKSITMTLAKGDNLTIIGLGYVLFVVDIPETPPTFGRLIDYVTAAAGCLVLQGGADSSISISNISVQYKERDVRRYRGVLDGLSIETFSNVTLRRVVVSQFGGKGIRLLSCTNTLVEECECTNNGYAGLAVDGGERVRILGGGYNSNGGYALGSKDGKPITVVEGYGLYCEADISIVSGVRAIYNVGKGIDTHRSRYIIIESNYVVGYGRCGIYALGENADKYVQDVIVRGNFVLDGDPGYMARGFHDYFGVPQNDASLLYGYLYAIEIGSAFTGSGEPLFSGSFIVQCNVIRGLRMALEGSDKIPIAIQVSTPDIGRGVPPEKVIIADNTIDLPHQSGPDSPNNACVAGIHVGGQQSVGQLLIRGNLVRVNETMAGILVETADLHWIEGNIVETRNTTNAIISPSGSWADKNVCRRSTLPQKGKGSE